MPVSYEDKTADISGDPPPERPLTQGQMKGAAGRQVHQKQRGPQVATPSAGKEQAQHGKDEKKADSPNGKPADSGKDSTSSVPQDTPAPPPPQGNPIIPVDWKAKAQEDPWTVHQHGQYVASALSSLLNLKAIPEGVAATGEALNYLGGVYNAATDPNAIKQSMKNIWNQNTAANNITK